MMINRYIIGAKPVSDFMKAFKENLEKEARNSARK